METWYLRMYFAVAVCVHVCVRARVYTGVTAFFYDLLIGFLPLS